MTSQRTILLGLFFLASLGVLAYYTLFLTDFTLFGSRPEMSVHFSETNGLREGDSVLVAGMRWGRVKRLTFDPNAPEEKRIVLTATLDAPLELRRGFTIEIRDATLLGGKNVLIDPGPAGAEKVPEDEALYGKVSGGLLDRVNALVTDSQEGIGKILADAQALMATTREGKGTIGRLLVDQELADEVESAVRDAARVLKDLQALTADARAGRGTVGKLLTEDSLFTDLSTAMRKLSTLLDEANRLAAQARGGEGPLGRLVSDEALGRDVAETLSGIRAIVKQIEAGRGVIGTLVQDEALAQDVRATISSIARGEGTIGALLVKPEVYENVRQVTEDFAAISAQLRSGQGSLGRLVMEDEIYQQVRTALQIIARSLEEYREAAPITTFTSVFFSAF